VPQSNFFTSLQTRSATPAVTPNSSDAAKANNDYTTFLKLLTAQMKNQDPLSPMDSTTFVSQLAQFSTVEQAVKTNTNLDTLMTQLKTTEQRADLSLLGKSVEAKTDQIGYSGSPVGFNYDLSAQADNASISILDGQGNVVRTIPAQSQVGRHAATWDGRNDMGLPVANGSYTVQVNATRKDNVSVSTNTYMDGTVTQVTVANDGTSQLKLDSGVVVPASAVTSVTTSSAAASASTPAAAAVNAATQAVSAITGTTP
jgi:flagellar basal-body rod modification protein FlgD